MPDLSNVKRPHNATAVIVLNDGSVFWGRGIGAQTRAIGEICFNTSMTGYQEILTDPSYAGQIITFTFPHIGNVGTNKEDIETLNPVARGLIVREDITAPSNWRAAKHFDTWLIDNNLVGITGVDTRALTRRIRDIGAPNGVICYNAKGEFDLVAMHQEAKSWHGLEGADLAKDVSCTQMYTWNEALWDRVNGYATQTKPQKKVVAVDFGAKRNILRCLAAAGCSVVVVPANSDRKSVV